MAPPKIAEAGTSSSSITSSTSTSKPTTTSTTSIVDIPELPMLTIFDHLSLSEVLHIDEVCRYWAKIKPAALDRRKQLIIANEKEDLEPPLSRLFSAGGTAWRDLLANFKKSYTAELHQALFLGRHQPLLPTATLERVTEQQLLPNLTVFQLHQRQGSPRELGNVAQLLSHYSGQLKEVALLFHGANRAAGGSGKGKRLVGFNAKLQQRFFHQTFTSLMVSLNRLGQSLRSLEFEFRAAPGCPLLIAEQQLVEHSLPDLVGRLERLQFRTCLEFDGTDDSERSEHTLDARLLAQLLNGVRDGRGGGGAGDQPESILQLYFPGTPLALRQLYELGPGPVAAGLRSLEIEGVFTTAAEYRTLGRTVAQTPHLQSLTVNVDCLSIWRLVEALAASLQELLHLYIRCQAHPGPPQETVDVRQLPALPSVKSLELTYPFCSHAEFEFLHLERLFPSLSFIAWNNWGWCCADCGYEVPLEEVGRIRGGYPEAVDWAQFKADYGRPMHHCLRLARLAAFSRLPQLSSLLLRVRPLNSQLPFKNQLFTSRRSLRQQTEFVDLAKGEDPDLNAVKYS